MGQTDQQNGGEKLVVGFACGWERDSKVKPGPINEKIVEKIFDLTKNTRDRVLMLGGNGPVRDKESMREADRMQQEFDRLVTEALKGGENMENIPEVSTDTEDYLAASANPYGNFRTLTDTDTETSMPRSYSTRTNADNLVTFILETYDDPFQLTYLDVVGLDEHLGNDETGRVKRIVLEKLRKAGLGHILVNFHPVEGQYNERNGQWRLRDEKRFKRWNKFALPI